VSIFVVTRTVGEYDELHTGVKVASHDKQKCEEYIAEKKKQFALLNQQYKQKSAYSIEWREQNPQPESPVPVPRPKWPSGLRREHITEEMRAERNRVDAINKEIWDKHGEVMDAWHEAHEVAMCKFIREVMGVSNENEIAKINDLSWMDEPRYEIKEIEVI